MEHGYEQQRVHLVVYHIFWCPKRRWKVLVGPLHDRPTQIIGAGVDEHDWQIIRLARLAIQPEHVHLFIRANPYTCPQTFLDSSQGAARTTCARRARCAL